MNKDSKLYGSTATYLQKMEVDEVNRKISEQYETDIDELAQIYSDPKNVPVHLNSDKRREIAFLARNYLKLKGATT